MVIFDPLSQEQLTHIVEIQIAQLARRLAARRLTLAVSDSAKLWLAERGYEPAYGARPLRRLIQQAIGDQLAKKLLSGEVRDGSEVHVDVIHAQGLLLCGGGGGLSCIGHHLDRDASIARRCAAFDFNWIHQYCAQYSSDSCGAVLLVRFVPNVEASVGK
ncbi:hypothetical protein FRC0285_01875 [Corynebacterium diphtheriae]|nr:hypothetical protein FRC0022_02047 [Corynebacterium diphtheriae]CAB0713352.1 hypothetical protein FRC0061_02104 [Corynebacterium diphtheriae]CAB0825076.1 hypothetical protein FRC0285_01875 [Corynebacterium diphtheriae]CAB0918595.1 hypothetical protein FRC0429_02114 [Corynebacterium diphtheriae]